MGLLFAVGFALPAHAAKSVTVEQLDQLLAAIRGKSDAKVAKQISGFELSERASLDRLAQWDAEFPGNRTRNALIAIADASAFLELPPAEVPSSPAPDVGAQRTILSRAIDYVSKAMPRLPNFSATRETVHFEDTPELLKVSQAILVQNFSQRGLRSANAPGLSTQTAAYQPLHVIGRSAAIVTYRDGYEVADKQTVKGQNSSRPVTGLTTSGEFGPVLSIVLDDSSEGEISWGYWEKGAAGLRAVFRYRVPQDQSHYRVALPNAQQTVNLSPAYHGEIAVDPETGDIWRISVVSDIAPPYQRVQTAIQVDYAPVAIGERTYMCPVKGVAFSKTPLTDANGEASQPASMQMQLNDVSFTHYHLFRSEMRILP